MDMKLQGKRQDDLDRFDFKLTITHKFSITREDCREGEGNPDSVMKARVIEEFNKLWAEMTNITIEQVERIIP